MVSCICIYVNCAFESSNFVCVVLCFQYELNPQEILKKISGFYGAHQSWVIIKSLTFHTNQPKIGPHGPEQGTYFQTNKEEGKITGILIVTLRPDCISVFVVVGYLWKVNVS